MLESTTKENIYHWVDDKKCTLVVFLCQAQATLVRWLGMRCNGLLIPVLLEFECERESANASTGPFRAKTRKFHFLWSVNTPENIQREAESKRNFHGPRWTPAEWAEWRARDSR